MSMTRRYAMTKVLVTGGAGFIGSNLVRKLVEEGHREVRVIDNLSSGKRENLTPILEKIDLQIGDIRDKEFVENQMRDTDVVFHHAAIASVDQSVKDPMTTNDCNIGGTLNVLLAARDNRVRRVVFASSSAVYGDSPALPKHEQMPADPLSPYALSKYVGEKYCQLFYQLYGVDTICLRYFNVFGPNQDPGSQYAAVIPLFTDAIINGKPITIYGDGEQTRDFVFIENAVSANLLAASAGAVAGKVFNIACGERISVNRLAKLLMDVLGQEVPVIHEAPRTGEVKHSLADISRAVELLGYTPSVDVSEGLRRSASWARSIHNAGN
jgi:UDP-N-acetylglucosamine/UDP-N-acetyl-alpha-D-glucosaminouronate 4-epimerase